MEDQSLVSIYGNNGRVFRSTFSCCFFYVKFFFVFVFERWPRGVRFSGCVPAEVVPDYWPPVAAGNNNNNNNNNNNKNQKKRTLRHTRAL